MRLRSCGPRSPVRRCSTDRGLRCCAWSLAGRLDRVGGDRVVAEDARRQALRRAVALTLEVRDRVVVRVRGRRAARAPRTPSIAARAAVWSVQPGRGPGREHQPAAERLEVVGRGHLRSDALARSRPAAIPGTPTSPSSTIACNGPGIVLDRVVRDGELRVALVEPGAQRCPRVLDRAGVSSATRCATSARPRSPATIAATSRSGMKMRSKRRTRMTCPP